MPEPLAGPKALITGITGQDRSYIAELLREGLRGARPHPPLRLPVHRPDRPPVPRAVRRRPPTLNVR
jgi:hypothetical protein